MKHFDKEHILLHSAIITAIITCIIVKLFNVGTMTVTSNYTIVNDEVAQITYKYVLNDLGHNISDKNYILVNYVQNFAVTFILMIACMSILFKMKAKAGLKALLLFVVCAIWIQLYSLLLKAEDILSTSSGFSIKVAFALTTLASSLLYYYVIKDHDRAIENEKLRSMYYSTQYEALRSKLDPHFLFNALNTLSGLIAINSDRTKEYIQKLSNIFRITLKHEEVAPLEDELRFASSYGDLMTIRYEDALQITYQIPEEMKARKVVSFSIQSLLENAIKHNTITKRLPMHIEIRTEGDYVVVSNPIHPRKETEESNGLGLKMLSERSTTLLKKDIVIENDNDTFTVKIPTA